MKEALKKLSLLSVLTALLLLLLPVQTLADSWVANTSYRKQFTINGSTDGNLTNYQLKLTINRSVGTDSGLTTYVGTKCDSTYKDIRFTKADGTTLLDYWIESSNATTAVVWVEFDSIPTSTTTNFYLYYGDANATAVSNGTNTFLFFDDGTGNLTSKWTAVTGTWAYDAGRLKHTGSGSWTQLLSTKTDFPNNLRVEYTQNMTSVAWVNVSQILMREVAANLTNQYEAVVRPGDAAAEFGWFKMVGGSESTVASTTATTWANNTTYKFTHTINGTSLKTYKDGGNLVSGTDSAISSGSFLSIQEYIAVGHYAYIDDFRVSNFASNEPAIIAWAAEEANVPTVVTQATTNVTIDCNGLTGGIFNGNLSSLGNLTSANVSFQYGLTVSYGTNTTPVAKNATGSFSAAMPTNLTPGSTYHYQAMGENGTYFYGSDGNFTLTMPSVTTTATANTTTEVTLNGNLTSLGIASNTTVYFEYGSTVAYGTNTSDQIKSSAGTFSANVTGFLHNMTYHYRAVAKIGSVVSNGSDGTFVIASGPLAEVGWYQPIAIISGTTLPDRAGDDQPGIITWGSNPNGLPVTIGGTEPTATPTATPTTGPTAYPTTNIPIPSTPGGWVGPGTPTFPGSDVPGDFETGGGVTIFWFVFPLILILLIGIFIHDKTKSLFAQATVMGLAIAFVSFFHIWPLWMIAPFAMMSGACVLAGKVYSY